MVNTRQPGHYWVKYMSDWTIGAFSGTSWEICGSDYLKRDEDFDEIDERPIVRHDQLPSTFNVKKGMSAERHLLENYYVALSPLPTLSEETVKWVTVQKGASIGMSSGIISPELGYIYHNTPHPALPTDITEEDVAKFDAMIRNQGGLSEFIKPEFIKQRKPRK